MNPNTHGTNPATTNTSASVENLSELHRRLMLANDQEQAIKLKQLISKWETEQMTIAFCGHFSAGKSSLINRLCGLPLLPSSPVPTSANIVSIKNGESGVFVTTANDNTESIPLEQLQQYCLMSSPVKSVEITYPIPILSPNISFLDTPGIDSADYAHLLSTESALHLADVVFYVMDYNHIQSEMNFSFAKRIKDWGKPLYLVINQIDKHKEQELTFSELKEQTEQAFTHWHINPDGILYISLKEHNHPMNEFGKLQWLIIELQKLRNHLIVSNIITSSDFLIEQHCSLIAATREPMKNKLRDKLNDDFSVGMALKEVEKLKAELQQIEQFPDFLIKQLKKEISSLVENANIIPSLTRELAHEYLQSRKPGFKASLFASGHKTTLEIEKRAMSFYDNFSEKIRAHIDWHMRDLVRKSCEAAECPSENLLLLLDDLKLEITPVLLGDQVSTGAVYSNEYTMTYTKQVAGLVKSMYRNKAYEIADLLAVETGIKAGNKKENRLIEFQKATETVEAYRELEVMEHDELMYAQSLRSLIQSNDLVHSNDPKQPDNLRQFNDANFTGRLPDLRLAPSAADQIQAAYYDVINLKHNKESLESHDNIERSIDENKSEDEFIYEHGNMQEQIRKAADQLLNARNVLQDLPAMKSVCRSMLDKAHRLHNNTFTIALFGAFSAGKSSFANALMGENLLPVSPNPTTAAINKIVSPQKDWPHGTAKVKMKTKDQVLDDVKYSLMVLGLDGSTMEDSIEAISMLSPSQLTGGGKTHYTFLKTVEQGWKAVEAQLGTEIKVDIAGFRKYVADEAMSCFVDVIELFYSCPLTDQGIILIDTPGADSINARHTGVAFNYIKNADAILFVTYYNHAFSHGDREFLLQLGRVKDSFEMDKMFFILNASDLAASEAELQQVTEHLSNNLLSFGIRHPRIFPLSSSQAVEGRMLKNKQQIEASGIYSFETSFHRFIYEELTLIAAASADHDIRRCITLLEQWIESAQQGETEKKQRKSQLLESYSRLSSKLTTTHENLQAEVLSQEVHELLFYIKQRLFFRFGDFYNMAFNPVVLQEDGRDIKAALRAAWHDLLRLFSFDLSQEIWAATLRIENFMNRAGQKQYEHMVKQTVLELPSYEEDPYRNKKFMSPEIGDILLKVDMNERLILGSFKSAKSFFEGGGKSKLKDELEKQLMLSVTPVLEQHYTLLNIFYTQQYVLRTQELSEQHMQSIEEHVEGIISVLEVKESTSDMPLKLQKLKGIVA